MARFSITESIEVGWDIAKNNFVLLLGGVVFTMLASAAPVVIMGLMTHLTESDTFISGMFTSIGSLAHFIIYSGLFLGLIKMSLALADKQKAEFGEIFNYFSLVFNFAVAQLIAGFIIVLGTILLIVPGIIFAIKLQFFPYFIVEQGCGPIEALQKSWEMTKDTKFQIFLFDLVVYLMNLLGMLCFGVGLFVTVVISIGAAAHVYRQLERKPETVSPISPIQ